jgi:hypothetical protein
MIGDRSIQSTLCLTFVDFALTAKVPLINYITWASWSDIRSWETRIHMVVKDVKEHKQSTANSCTSSRCESSAHIWIRSDWRSSTARLKPKLLSSWAMKCRVNVSYCGALIEGERSGMSIYNRASASNIGCCFARIGVCSLIIKY